MKHALSILILISILINVPVAGAESSDNKYTLRIGDVLEINVINEPGLKSTTIVATDGTITFPYIGTVYIKDMKIIEVEKKITEKLSDGYIKYPVVSVALLRSTGRKFYVYGELSKTGAFEFVEDMTVVKAISIAGGINPDGLYGRAKVRRKQDSSHRYNDIYIDLESIVEGSVTGDMLLQVDDILIVERNKTFLIQGEVAKRGRFVLEKDMTVLKALLQAGSVSEQGLYGKIKVRRKQEGIPGEYKDFVEAKLNDGVIESSEVEDTLLQPDDILIVERNETFLIQGEVSNRGRFLLEKDMTVLKALLQAGGVTNEGLYGKIKVRRKQEGMPGGYKDFVEAKLKYGVIESSEVEDTLLQPDDILVIKRNETYFMQGEVSRTGQFILEYGMTVVKAISVAGGISPDGIYGKVKVRRKQDDISNYKDIEIDFKGADKDSAMRDMLLEADDIVIVEKNKTYFVYGEIQGPGEYVLKDDMTVFKAITLAGGFTKWGSPDRIKILRPNENGSGNMAIKVDIDAVIDGDSSADINLLSGDQVIAEAGVL